LSTLSVRDQAGEPDGDGVVDGVDVVVPVQSIPLSMAPEGPKGQHAQLCLVKQH